MIFKLMFVFFFGINVSASELGPPCKMVSLHKHNADDPEFVLEHMAMNDGGRKLDFFFGTHVDPATNHVSALRPLVKNKKAYLKYVRDQLADPANQKMIAAFKKDRALYKKFFSQNASRLKWIGHEGSAYGAKDPLDASASHKRDHSIAGNLLWNTTIVNIDAKGSDKLSNEQIDDFILLVSGPYFDAQLESGKLLKGISKKFTDEESAYLKSLDIFKQEQKIKSKYADLEKKARYDCRDLSKTKVITPACKKSFTAWQNAEKEAVPQLTALDKKFKAAQDARDVALVDVVDGFKGDGVIFRGGDHQKLVQKLMEKRCLERLNQTKPGTPTDGATERAQ